jgi:lipopolysaccharide export LptBFGC system permease protein LptF
MSLVTLRNVLGMVFFSFLALVFFNSADKAHEANSNKKYFFLLAAIWSVVFFIVCIGMWIEGVTV